MKIVKIIGAILVAFVMMVSMSGCSTISTQPDEVGLHYSGGAFSSVKFKNCVNRDERHYYGPGDHTYKYPWGQRTFSFTGKAGSESQPIAVTTGSQEVDVPGFVTFRLNTDCKTLRKFHETIGMKYKAYEADGWNEFLNDYIATPLSNVMNKAAGSIQTPKGTSRDQNWYALYTDGATQKAFEDYVKTNLSSEIDRTAGGGYITVESVSIAKPTVSAALKDALSQKEQARLANVAQQQKNEVAITKYKSFQNCRRAGLSENACLTIYLADNGSIPFYTVPQGGSINVNPSK